MTLFDGFPELIARQSFPRRDAPSRFAEQSLESRRARQHDPFQVFFVYWGEQHRHGFAVPRNDHRPFSLAFFQVSAQTRFHIRYRRNFHNLNSSPAISNRFFSFTPMARINTSRSSKSTP